MKGKLKVTQNGLGDRPNIQLTRLTESKNRDK